MDPLSILLGAVLGLLVGSMLSTGWGRWAFQAGARAALMELVKADAITPTTAAAVLDAMKQQAQRLP